MTTRATPRQQAAVAGGPLFELEKAEVPWGDYGDILVHGMTAHLSRRAGLLQLERTGPHVPPVTLPGLGDVVVTDAARFHLARAVPGLGFREVRKARIVRLDWSAWDREAEEPAMYPESGEPEDYILARQHSRALAEELGPLWELVPSIIPGIQGPGGTFDAASYGGEHLVRATLEAGIDFVSPRLGEALRALSPQWIALRPV